MDSHTIEVCTAILCLTILEGIAVCKGKNGTVLRLVITAIAGLAGFSLGRLIK